METVTSPEEVTPQWLTHLVGPRLGTVTKITVLASFTTPPSTLHRLEVEAILDGRRRAHRLILKLPRRYEDNEALTQSRFNMAANEIGIYRAAFLEHRDLPIPQCFAAAADGSTQTSYLLLKDHGDTHRYVPNLSLQQAQATVAAIAHVHARWWNDPRLGTTIGDDPVAALDFSYGSQVRRTIRRKRLVELHAALPSLLDQSRLGLFDRLIERAPALLFQRLQAGPLTLCHNDFHTGNYLIPANPELEDVLLIDWGTAKPWWGALDLGWLVVFGLDPAHRREVELDLLKLYLTNLESRGMRGYLWDSLLEDYRLSILQCMYRALEIPRADILTKVVAACQEHNCSDLLGERTRF
ncbi:MAG: phosphotransferase [Candidatus Latescibacteria bacterium]|nr:phosphotransferase [Candidatus Latescibacterota bacterium]